MDVQALGELARRHRAVVSLEAAAQLRGYRLLDEPAAHCLTVPRNRSAGCDPALTWLRQDLDPRDIDVIEGVPVTSAMRTLTDLARRRSLEAAVVIADSALECDDVTAGQLRAVAGLSRGPGACRLRAVAKAADGRSQSAPETLVRLWLQRDVRVGEVLPPMRLFEGGHPYDFGLPALRAVAEFQSWQWHGERRVWVKDTRWGNQAYARGWGYVQLVHEDRLAGPDHVIATVLGQLA